MKNRVTCSSCKLQKWLSTSLDLPIFWGDGQPFDQPCHLFPLFWLLGAFTPEPSATVLQIRRRLGLGGKRIANGLLWQRCIKLGGFHRRQKLSMLALKAARHKPVKPPHDTLSISSYRAARVFRFPKTGTVVSPDSQHGNGWPSYPRTDLKWLPHDGSAFV